MTKEEIIQIVCDVCEISPADLKVRSRKEPLPTARALIAHFLYTEMRMPAREIRPLIGHPSFSRTSVNFYLPTKNRKASLVQDRSPFDKGLAEQLDEIEKRLKSRS